MNRPDLPLQPALDGGSAAAGAFLEVNAARIPVRFRASARARHYIIHVRRDATVTVTVPSRGTISGARRFLESRRAWIARALARLQSRPIVACEWQPGTEVLFRGQVMPLRTEPREAQLAVFLGPEFCGLTTLGGDLRPSIEQWLKGRAVAELPGRVLELAALHQSPVRRVTIRDQRTRWGSCSRRGTISLNWRLIQVTDSVRDYIILHELMHLREMNHSPRFWRHVEGVCPRYRECERWLKEHGPKLGR